MARTKSERRRRQPARDPRQLPREDLERLIADSERRLDVMAAFQDAEEWRLVADYLDGRTKRLEHEGKGLRRRLMRPIGGQPLVTLEQIAAHEARIDENAVLRRLPKVILALWTEQLTELHTIRDAAAR